MRYPHYDILEHTFLIAYVHSSQLKNIYVYMYIHDKKNVQMSQIRNILLALSAIFAHQAAIQKLYLTSDIRRLNVIVAIATYLTQAGIIHFQCGQLVRFMDKNDLMPFH